MSHQVDQPETQVEQPIEQPIEEAPKPPRRTRGKTRYQEKHQIQSISKIILKKTKPNLYVDENQINCPLCNKKSFMHNLKRHQDFKSCRLFKLEQEKHQQTISL